MAGRRRKRQARSFPARQEQLLHAPTLPAPLEAASTKPARLPSPLAPFLHLLSQAPQLFLSVRKRTHLPLHSRRVWGLHVASRSRLLRHRGREGVGGVRAAAAARGTGPIQTSYHGGWGRLGWPR